MIANTKTVGPVCGAFLGLACGMAGGAVVHGPPEELVCRKLSVTDANGRVTMVLESSARPVIRFLGGDGAPEIEIERRSEALLITRRGKPSVRIGGVSLGERKVEGVKVGDGTHALLGVSSQSGVLNVSREDAGAFSHLEAGAQDAYAATSFAGAGAVSRVTGKQVAASVVDADGKERAGLRFSRQDRVSTVRVTGADGRIAALVGKEREDEASLGIFKTEASTLVPVARIKYFGKTGAAALSIESGGRKNRVRMVATPEMAELATTNQEGVDLLRAGSGAGGAGLTLRSDSGEVRASLIDRGQRGVGATLGGIGGARVVFGVTKQDAVALALFDKEAVRRLLLAVQPDGVLRANARVGEDREVSLLPGK